MKVLHIISGLRVGGAETQLYNLVKNFKNKNNSIKIVSFKDGPYSNKLKSLNIDVSILDIDNVINFILSLISLVRIIKNFKPDIVHSWMYHANILSFITNIFVSKKIKKIWSIRCSNMKFSFFSSIKLVFFLNYLFSNFSDVLVYNSNAGKKYHEIYGFNNKKTITIYNGFDTEKYKKRFVNQKKFKLKNNIPLNFKIGLSIARVDNMKNYQSLIKISKSIDNFFLIIVGRGTEKFNYKNIKGFGEKNELSTFYNIADFFILNSSYGEGFSNVLAEAMLSGLVPISTDVGDSKLILDKYGILINPDSEIELKKSIKKIIDNPFSENYINSMINYLKNKFNNDIMTKNYIKLYNDITNAKQ
ncbi:glycosyltransferase [Pelagibacteraceae bacterium]|nr:glycosyltransferase [Pelagibacteraceae bacterium]